MNLIAISGAHRNGNTERLLSEFVKGCRFIGAKVKTYKIRKMKISPCCGWSDCYYANYCIVKDNMKALVNELVSADAWVLATPVYFDDVSSYMKIFMERLNPYCNPPRFRNKKVFLLAVGGASGRSISKCLQSMKSGFARHMGLKVVGQLSAVADKKNEILENKAALARAFNAGKRFAKTTLDS